MVFKVRVVLCRVVLCRSGSADIQINLGNSQVGRDSSAGIATRYGQDGPGIDTRWGRDFSNPFGAALGPTQPPVQWVPGLFHG